MSTNDADDDLVIPEFSEIDWSRAKRGRYWRRFARGYDIEIDGAVMYRLRQIPSNRTLATATRARALFAACLMEIEAGRNPRTLAMDWYSADGRAELLSAGPRLASWAHRTVHGTGAPIDPADVGKPIPVLAGPAWIPEGRLPSPD